MQEISQHLPPVKEGGEEVWEGGAATFHGAQNLQLISGVGPSMGTSLLEPFGVCLLSLWRPIRC